MVYYAFLKWVRLQILTVVKVSFLTSFSKPQNQTTDTYLLLLMLRLLMSGGARPQLKIQSMSSVLPLISFLGAVEPRLGILLLRS
jgi:hypothetical protein